MSAIGLLAGSTTVPSSDASRVCASATGTVTNDMTTRMASLAAGVNGDRFVRGFSMATILLSRPDARAIASAGRGDPALAVRAASSRCDA